jgi:hypothetical protein
MGDFDITAPATPEAERWQGWGTALKPAWEPVIVARKPLIGTVAANVTRYGTGAINVDGCRIGTTDTLAFGSREIGTNGIYSPIAKDRQTPGQQNPQGRWPANVVLSHHEDCVQVGTKRVKSNSAGTAGGNVEHAAFGGGMKNRGNEFGYADPDGTETVAAWDCHDECPVRLLDAQSGERKTNPGTYRANGTAGMYGASRKSGMVTSLGDTGGASRFFYTSKASRSERSAGLPEGMTNTHPTVKSLGIMRWLVRLVTPPGGTVLDPFAGSGSTGCACALEGFQFIGIEQSVEYAAIAERRISYWSASSLQLQGIPEKPKENGVYAGGKGRRSVPRCPEHDQGHDPATRSQTYKCGCRLSYRDYTARPTVFQPALELEGVAD